MIKKVKDTSPLTAVYFEDIDATVSSRENAWVVNAFKIYYFSTWSAAANKFPQLVPKEPCRQTPVVIDEDEVRRKKRVDADNIENALSRLKLRSKTQEGIFVTDLNSSRYGLSYKQVSDLTARDDIKAVIDHFSGKWKLYMLPPVKMTKWELEQDPIIRRRVGKTGEECSELLKVCCRISLQGLNGINPSSKKSNREELLEEMADVEAQVQCTVKALEISTIERLNYFNRINEKKRQMDEWEDIEITGRDWEDRS